MIEKIEPDYSRRPKCHFCGREEATEGCEDVVTLYQLKGKRNKKQRRAEAAAGEKNYYQTDVKVPCCRTCDEKRGAGCLPALIVGVIVFVTLAGIFIYRVQTGGLSLLDATLTGFNKLFLYLTITLIVGLGVYKLIAIIVSKFRGTSERKGNYAPVKILRKLGFRYLEPDATDVARKDIDPEKLREAIETIKRDHCCKVTLRNIDIV